MQSNQNGCQEPTLEEALAECLRVTESNPDTNREQLLTRFPRWRSELDEFFADWEKMERLSSGLSGRHRALRTRASLGTKVSYFGDYELLEEIGYGGMGIIFKARQISLDRIVALKMILDPRHDRDRFRLEAEAAARVQHPHIVSIYEIGKFEGHPYFSMQFIDGGNLSDRIATGPIPPCQAAEWTATVARAVHFAHQHGILHRDLKPANILLDSKDQPYVSDFGLAKQVQDDQRITQTGAILGTPGYMAPEQATGRVANLTVASDVHGLGAVLYAALVGEAPYCGQTTLETLRLVTDQAPRAPRSRHAEIPRDLETVCLKCLEKDPQARYSSAESLADDLDRFLCHEPIEARPVSQLERLVRWSRRNPTIASLTAVIVLLLIASSVISSILASNFKQARDAAKITLADSFTSKGITSGEHDKPGDALLWFSGAASVAEGDARRVRDNLRRVDSYRQRVLEPVAALWLRDADVSSIQFDADSTHLLCGAGGKSEVWDFKSNQHWRLSDLLPNVTCSSLSSSGHLLAAGARNGHVVLADVQTRETLHRFELRERIRKVVFTRDGTMLAMAAGKRVHLWDCQQMTAVGSAIDHPRSVLHVAFDGQGDRLLTVCRSAARGRGEIRLFQRGDAEALFDPIGCLVEQDSEWRTAFWPAFISSGRQLLVVHLRDREDHMRDVSNSNFRVYDVDTGQHVWSPSVGGSNCLVVSPDTRTIVNCGGGHARIREFTPGNKLIGHRERLVHRQRIVAADFSFNGRLVATGGWDRDVRLWAVGEVDPIGVSSNAPRSSLAHLAHQTRVTRVKFSPDSRLLATVQMDGLIRVSQIPESANAESTLRIRGATRLKPLAPRAQSALTKAMKSAGTTSSAHAGSHNSLYAITGTSHGQAQGREVTVRRWMDGQRVGPKIGVEGILMDADFSPTGEQLVTINAPPDRSQKTMFQSDGSAGTLRFWSWPEGEPLFGPLSMPAEPRSVAYRSDGRQLAVMCAQGEVLVIDTQVGAVTSTWKTSTRKLSNVTRSAGHGRVRYSPDGRSLIAWAHGVWVWDVDLRRIRYAAMENANHLVPDIDISADGQLLSVAGGRNLDVRVLALPSGRLLGQPMRHPDNVFTARFNPDGQRLVSACRDGQARVYAWRTGELVLPGMVHGLDVVNATFTPDDRYLLTIGLDATVRAWHANDGRLALLPHRVSFRDRQILLSPNSRSALVTGITGEIHNVPLAPLYDEPRTSIGHAKLLGELLSNQSIHGGGSVRLTTGEWLDRWDRLSE